MATKHVGCERPGCANRHWARGMCRPHYNKTWRAGVEDPRPLVPHDEIIAELIHLGINRHLPIAPQLREYAPRIGVSVKAAERAWYRAKRLGEVA